MTYFHALNEMLYHALTWSIAYHDLSHLAYPHTQYIHSTNHILLPILSYVHTLPSSMWLVAASIISEIGESSCSEDILDAYIKIVLYFTFRLQVN